MMKRKVMDKRGLEMAINTIVTMVLAIAVLLFMFLFFTDAGGEFLGKVKGHSSYSNVDIVVDNCNFYADTEAEYSYCCEKKGVGSGSGSRTIDRPVGCHPQHNFNCYFIL